MSLLGWQIWWLVGVGLFFAYATFVWFAWRDVEEYVIPAQEVARIDHERRRMHDEWLQEDLRHHREPA